MRGENYPLEKVAQRRHTRLWEALTDLEATHKPQAVEVPEDQWPRYYQKYIHTLAGRMGLRVKTGMHIRGGQALVFIQERQG